MKNRALFLDRDGVINEPIVIEGKPYSPKNLSELKFCRNVDIAIRKAKELGLLVIIFTNQPEIARGTMLKENVDKIHKYIIKLLHVDDIFMCPHDDKDDCSCRKPKPGMLYEASAKWNINLKESFVVGDRWRDIDAGKKAGCTTFLIKSDYYNDKKPINYDYSADNLISVIEIISKLLNKKEEIF
jgi:D-glycero-D-manno-heptose 1,7-bisphosphate phosphatase